MQQEFIPYAEALAMKELGFNEKCLRFHHVDGKLNEVSFPEDIGAPLYQQAFRWFREKHTLVHEMVWCKQIWYFAIGDFKNNIPKHQTMPHSVFVSSDEYNTYEEAQLACLQQLIKTKNNGE